MKERQQISEAINNLNKYRILREEIRELQFSERFIIDNFKKIPRLYKNPLIDSKNNCLSKRAVEHWYYIQVLKEHLKRNLNKSLNWSIEYIEFLNQNEELFNAKKLLPAISNYLYHSALTSNKKHFQIGLTQLKDLNNDKLTSPVYMAYILFTRSVEFAYFSEDHKMTLKYIPLLCNFLNNNISYLEEAQIQYIFMVIIRACIITKNYDLGMEYIFKWNNIGVREHKKLQHLLFSIIIYFALSNFTLVKKEIRQLNSLKGKFKPENPLIEAFVKYYNSMIKQNIKEEQVKLQFQNALYKVSINDNNNFDFLSFNFYKWSMSI